MEGTIYVMSGSRNSHKKDKTPPIKRTHTTITFRGEHVEATSQIRLDEGEEEKSRSARIELKSRSLDLGSVDELEELIDELIQARDLIFGTPGKPID